MKSISIKKVPPRTLNVIRASFERSCEIIGLEKMGEVQTCMGLSTHGGGCLLTMACTLKNTMPQPFYYLNIGRMHLTSMILNLQTYEQAFCFKWMNWLFAFHFEATNFFEQRDLNLCLSQNCHLQI